MMVEIYDKRQDNVHINLDNVHYVEHFLVDIVKLIDLVYRMMFHCVQLL